MEHKQPTSELPNTFSECEPKKTVSPHLASFGGRQGTLAHEQAGAPLRVEGEPVAGGGGGGAELPAGVLAVGGAPEADLVLDRAVAVAAGLPAKGV